MLSQFKTLLCYYLMMCTVVLFSPKMFFLRIVGSLKAEGSAETWVGGMIYKLSYLSFSLESHIET